MTPRPRPDQFDATPPVPRFALTPEEAAHSIGVSLSTLNTLVADGLIPKPFSPPGHPRLVRYDPLDLSAAVKGWKELGDLGPDKGGWNGVR